ncbi:hypothetical protein AAC03nite_01160 [Alicyclobacillus acidoterrestris]|nr:hypothetical protein AAC03nite_01160 [Alicyclobacillus acidoterrestris]
MFYCLRCQSLVPEERAQWVYQTGFRRVDKQVYRLGRCGDTYCNAPDRQPVTEKKLLPEFGDRDID